MVPESTNISRRITALKPVRGLHIRKSGTGAATYIRIKDLPGAVVAQLLSMRYWFVPGWS